VSLHGDVVRTLGSLRAQILGVMPASSGLPMAMNVLRMAQEDGREPTGAELLQACALLMVAAEAKLADRPRGVPTPPRPPESSEEADTN
jgi:hypothetical protein